MDIQFIVFVVIAFIVIVYLSARQIRHARVTVLRPDIGTKCALTSIRGDTCVLNEYRPCQPGSYDQCTNNVPPASKCVCSNQRGFELCDKDLQISDACYMKEYDLMPNLDIEAKYSNDSSLPRVNRYVVDTTPHDIVD
jgi:hypothetical protein